MSGPLRYPVVRLETLAANQRNAMVGGPFGSNLVSRDYTQEGVPVIRGTNLASSKYVSNQGLLLSQSGKPTNFGPTTLTPAILSLLRGEHWGRSASSLEILPFLDSSSHKAK